VKHIRPLIYFSIAFLTAGVTDPFVLMAQNDPAMLDAMHPFQWVLIFFRSLLAGLVTLRAFAEGKTPPDIDSQNKNLDP